MSKSFFIDKTPPIPPPYCDIALILRTINLIFTRTQRPRCLPPGSFHENFTRKIGLKTLLLTTKFYTKNRVKDITFNYKINNYCRHNQHGYLGSHAQQRRHLFYIFKNTISSRCPPRCPLRVHLPLSSNNP